MSESARDFDAGAIGSRSNVETRKPMAPVIERTIENGSTRPVRFDGHDGSVMIDRKVAVVTTQKAKNQALRQSQALRENGMQGLWEVTSEAQASRARRMFTELGIDNIMVEVVNGP